MPFVAVDALIKHYEKKKLAGIVLVERKNPPKGWALPGGFVDYGETLEQAVKREAREETGLKIKIIRQLHTYSNPKRDPRIHCISVAFLCKASGKLKHGSDAKKVKVFPLNRLPKLAFDHKKMVSDSKSFLRD